LTFGPGPQINSSPVRAGQFRICGEKAFLDFKIGENATLFEKPE
jgi:hypothetical protein